MWSYLQSITETFHSNNKIHLPSLWRAIHNLQVVVNTQITIYIKTSHLTFDRRYSLQAIITESLSQFLNNLVFLFYTVCSIGHEVDELLTFIQMPCESPQLMFSQRDTNKLHICQKMAIWMPLSELDVCISPSPKPI